MKIKLLAAIGCLGYFLTPAIAEASAVWMNGVTVKEIYASGSDGFVLTFSSSNASCTNAQTPDKYFYVSPTATPIGYTLTENGVRNFLAMAMEALAAGKTVDVLFDSATNFCYIAALIVHA